MSGSRRDRRLHELLVERALGGLSVDGERELRALEAGRTPAHDDSFEIAAAAVHLALLGGAHEPLPGGLRARLGKVLTQE